MAPSILQSATGFAAALAASLDATLAAPATAGNLLLFMVGGDKNLGTVTLTGYTQAVYLASTDCTLLMAIKTAVGGETLVSATYTSGNGAGSNISIVEIQDNASAGAWEQKATAGTSANAGATVTTKTSGTTGTIAALGGLAIAAFTVDSVNTSPTPSYTNSYAGFRSMSNGGSEAGLWAAQLAVSSGGTTTTTIDRDPTVTGTVTADQMAGGVIVVGRQLTAAPAPGVRIPQALHAALVR